MPSVLEELDFLREKAGNLTDTQDLNFSSPLCNGTLDCNREQLFLGVSKLYPLPRKSDSEFSKSLAYSVIALAVVVLLLSCIFLLFKLKALKARASVAPDGGPSAPLPRQDRTQPPACTAQTPVPSCQVVFSTPERRARNYEVHYTTSSKQFVEESQELRVAATTNTAPPDCRGIWTLSDV